MPSFSPRATTFRGRVLARGDLDRIFALFSPLGEKAWVPGWDPELLDPPGAEWEEGQIFRTREETGEALWIVTRLERERRAAEYHRVEPGRYVARVRVRCRPVPDDRIEASIAYSYIGLSEAGNREIVAMTQQAFDEKMARWTEWIDHHLGAGAEG